MKVDPDEAFGIVMAVSAYDTPWMAINIFMR
ncbi:hypothetical protein MCEMAEM4_01428 [Burkholderiaceae bacterium]